MFKSDKNVTNILAKGKKYCEEYPEKAVRNYFPPGRN